MSTTVHHFEPFGLGRFCRACGLYVPSLEDALVLSSASCDESEVSAD